MADLYAFDCVPVLALPQIALFPFGVHILDFHLNGNIIHLRLFLLGKPG